MARNWEVIKQAIGRAWNQLPHLGRALSLIWGATRAWTIAWLVLLILQGLLPVAIVYLSRVLVDGLVEVMGSGGSWEDIRSQVIWIVLFAGVLLLKEVLRSLTSVIRVAQAERVRDHITAIIHQKSAQIDLTFYDSPDFYDQLYRARVGAGSRPMALLESTGVLLQNGITMVSMLLVLLPYGAWLPLVLLVSTLPAFYVVLRHRLHLHNWTVRNTEIERRTWYYDWLLTVREAAAELRLFQLSDYFQSAYQKLRKRVREERVQLAREQGAAETWAGSVALLITALTMGWMVWRLVSGEYTLGDLALFFQAFNQGQILMRSFMENVGEIYSNSFFLGDLFEFLALQPKVLEPAQPTPLPDCLQEQIEFSGITFSYPGNQKPVLQDFNLSLNAGQIAAIVGPNGAGKSTLIKLLCRFYDPQAGAITLDRIDLRQFSPLELRRRITVLFQEPVNYSATARESIALGDLTVALDSEAIPAAAELAGADEPISRLPQGYETLLGKWFKGGVDLSVGEWQRLALARAFLRQAPVIILDEPTSAMDPWAEADWLERFRSMAEGRMAILITHRFTTAAYADIIHVMEDGQIVESGSHVELLEMGGRYAASWRKQMRRWSQPITDDLPAR